MNRGSLGVVEEWLARAGFTADVLRWFCGPGGRVVVEQEAGGAARGAGVRVGSQFVVSGGLISHYQRHESLRLVLQAAGLGPADEVTSRLP
jgi:hypothetical protein